MQRIHAIEKLQSLKTYEQLDELIYYMNTYKLKFITSVRLGRFGEVGMNVFSFMKVGKRSVKFLIDNEYDTHTCSLTNLKNVIFITDCDWIDFDCIQNEYKILEELF